MSKSLRKTIMNRSKLTNKCDKNRADANLSNHKKQTTNINNSIIKNPSDGNKFWDNIKIFLFIYLFIYLFR